MLRPHGGSGRWAETRGRYSKAPGRGALGHALLSAPPQLGATWAAPTLTRGPAPLPLSPTAALWAKPVELGAACHGTSASPLFPLAGCPHVPKGRGPTPPPEKQRPGPPRRSPSAIPVGHGQRLKVERAGRSGCRSAVITRPSFHTLSSPPVPGTSPEPGAGGFGRQQISRPSLGFRGYVEVSDGAGRPHPDRGFPASAGARVWGCGPAGGSGAAAITPAPCPRTRAFGQEDALSSAGARRADASRPR